MSDDSTARELTAVLSSAVLVAVGTVLGSLSKLVERVVVGRALTVEAYGEVSVGLAVLTVGSMVAMFGFDQGIPRYMSRFDEERRVRGAWLTGVTLAVGVGALLAGGLLLAAERMTTVFLEGSADPTLLRLFAVAIPLAAGLHAGVAGIRGMENTRYRTYVQDLLYPLVRIGLLAAFLAAGYGVLAAGYAYVVAAAVGFVAAHALLDRLLPLRGAFEVDVPEMLRFSGPLVVASVLSILLVQTDTLMLGYFDTSRAVALYGAAYPLAYGLLLVLSAFGFVYLPLASRLDAAGSHDELDTIYTLTTKWIFVVTFPAFLAFVAFPDDVLTVFFGAEYAGGAPALIILSVGFFVNAAAGRNRQTLSALGRTDALMVANAVTFGVNIGLNLLLIPRYSFVGAAVASAASYATLNLTVSAYLYGRFGISPLSGPSVRTFVALPAVLVPAGVFLAGRVTLSAVTLLPFLVVAGAASLVVVVLVGGVQPEDGVLVRFVEERVGARIPYVHRHLPDDTDVGPN